MNTPDAIHHSAREKILVGEYQSAIELLQPHLAKYSDDADSWNMLAIAFFQNRRIEESMKAFRTSLQIRPDVPKYWADFVVALSRAPNFTHEFLSTSRQAIQRFPHIESNWLALIQFCQKEKDLITLESLLQQALQHIPNCTAIHAACARHFEETGRIDQAEQAIRTVLTNTPGDLDALYHLGSLLYKQGKIHSACDTWEKIYRSNPSHLRAATNLMTGKRQICDWLESSSLHSAVRTGSEQAMRAHRQALEDPTTNISFYMDMAYNLQVAQSWAKRFCPAQDSQARETLKRRPERIRIAFLSDELRDHAVGNLLKDLFAKFDRSRFQVYTYFDHAAALDDAVSQHIRDSSDAWIRTSHLSHSELAQAIRSDAVHILVDLKGWRDNNRMSTLASRPCPICVQYLGFPGTTGTEFVDYLISDTVVVKENENQFFTEKLAYVNRSYFPNPDSLPSQTQLALRSGTRQSHGLPAEGIVFASFNQAYKLEPATFGAWMRIMNACPGSVLWLLELNPLAQTNLKHFASSHGIDSSQLVFAPWATQLQHLARTTHVDVGLDTLVYNGHTTTSNLLWAGIPVVTVRGQHFASRVSASLLHAAELDDLIVQNLDEYCSLAIELARNSEGRAAIKSRLSESQLRRTLFDPQSLVQDLESLFGQMIDRYVQGLSPAKLHAE